MWQLLSLYNSPTRISNNPILQPDSTSLLIGSTIDSEYIPFSAIFNGAYRSIEGYSYIEYSIPSIDNAPAYMRSNVVLDSISRIRYPIKYERLGESYYIFKGMIFCINESGEVELLLVQVLDWDYVKETNYLRSLVTPDTSYSSIYVNPDKTKVLISNKFLDYQHKSMMTYINRYVLSGYRSIDVDLIYTNNIRNYVFKNPLMPIRFRNTSLMNNYFESLTKTSIDEFVRR